MSETYSLQSDFSGNVDIQNLMLIINENNIITQKCLTIQNTNAEPDALKIFFESNLNIDEKKELDEIVNNYVYVLYVDSNFVIISDIKNAGTNGGDFDDDRWIVRELNTIHPTPVDWCTISLNTFTLRPGAYKINCSAPAYRVDFHQIRLYNNTDDIVEKVGIQSYSKSKDEYCNVSNLKHYLENEKKTTYQIEHICSKKSKGSGFGLAGGFAVETYTTVTIEKIN